MPNIRTLKPDGNDDERSDSEPENEQQGFYVGGSEHSGQEVLGPPRPRDRDFVERLFNEAQRHGAEQVSAARPSEENPAGTQSVRLTMYSDGFTIDDGPFRSYTDEASKEFMTQIAKGHIPNELRAKYPGVQLDVRMERKAGEYVPPKPKAFDGAGQRLGAVVPQVVTNSAPASSSQSDPAEAAKLVEQANAEVKIDSNSPITSVQVRLPQGKSIVGKFNQSHTITALRSFIVTAVPDLHFSEFQLMTTFPNKIIDDETMSLKDAGLLNAVVMVKIVG